MQKRMKSKLMVNLVEHFTPVSQPGSQLLWICASSVVQEEWISEQLSLLQQHFHLHFEESCGNPIKTK